MKYLLFLLLAGGAPAKELEKTDQDVVAYVIKTDVPDLDPKLTRRFLSLDLSLLPAKSRAKAELKKLAIETAVKIHAGAKKGGIRTVPAGSASCVPERHPASYGRILESIGFEEIEEEIVECVEQKTNCTEDDLMCEFTLNVTLTPRPPKAPKKRYYLNGRDPLMGKVAECRGKAGGQTNFFGSGVFACNRLTN